jgi:hypothetical protein
VKLDWIDADPDDLVRFDQADEVFGIPAAGVEDNLAGVQLLRGEVVEPVGSGWVQAHVEVGVHVPGRRAVHTCQPVEVLRSHDLSLAVLAQRYLRISSFRSPG